MYNIFQYLEQDFFNNQYCDDVIEWLNNYWKISILIIMLYLLFIHVTRTIMKNNKPYKLRFLLFLWNASLAIFSILGTVRMLPIFISIINTKGFEYTTCIYDYRYGTMAYWSWLFVLSKILELIDTVFILLRKQPLIFLHWYHHATVLLYAWYSASLFNSTSPWFIVMNYFVHSIMYSYYACKVLKININKKIMITITSLQILQMVIGIYINAFAYYIKSNKRICNVTYENIYLSFIMYFTYFILFSFYFCKAYLK